MKIRTVQISLRIPVPYVGETAYTPHAHPEFGATAEVEKGEDPGDVANRLYDWVLWNFLQVARAAHGTHCKVRGDFDEMADRYFKRNPSPPELPVVGRVRKPRS